MKRGQLWASLVAAAAALVACGPEPLSLAAFEAQRLHLECIGSDCLPELSLRLHGGVLAEKRCELEDDVRATQDGQPMKQLSRGEFHHYPGFLWEPPEDYCLPARWALVDDQPREVTTFEVSDGTATLSMQLRLAFDARSAELVTPTPGVLRAGDTVELHWTPAEDRLTAASGLVGPDGPQLATVNFLPVEGAVYRGTVEVHATGPTSGEFTVMGLRESSALVTSCSGVVACDHQEYSLLSFGNFEVRPAAP